MTTNPEFSRDTTATEVAKVFSDEIRGKVVVIVGVSPQSLGESMALALAAHEPALLVFASRTKSKMEQVSTKVKSMYENTKIELVEVDLALFASIREAASAINGIVDQIDILINNAAIVVQRHEFTADGLEMQFGTNHIGPFLLTNLLLPKIIKAAENAASKGSTRIINLTSQGHVISPIRFSDTNFKQRPENIPLEERPMSRPGVSFDPPPGETYVTFVSYGQSKTANILFSVSLTQKLAGKGIRSIATHPGSIWTDLSRNLDSDNQDLISKTAGFWKDLDQGASTTLVAALDPKLSTSDLDVIYLSDCQIAQAADHARDTTAAKRLWQLSETIVGQNFVL